MADKIYCNGFFVRARETQYGEMLNCSIDLKEFGEFARKHAKDGQLRLTIGRRKSPSQSGVTHSVALDTYVPKSRRQEADELPRAKSAPTQPAPDDDVPF